MMIIRKVKSEQLAKRMIDFADLKLIAADYEHKGKWYVVTFDCSQYVWLFFEKQLKKNIRPHE